MNLRAVFSHALRCVPESGFALVCFVSLFVPAALAQVTGPHIGYVYPAGGKQGTGFQVRVGGQFLDGATNAYFSAKGIKATILSHTKPLTPQQANALRERMKELQQKRNEAMRARRGAGTNVVWTAADMRAFDEIRTRLATFQRRPSNPAIAETVVLQVNVDADTQPGKFELRVRAAQGLSNPLTFCVGQLPEVCKPEPAVNRFPNRTQARNAGEGQAVPASEMTISIPATINGQIFQGGVDRYRFRGRAGQKLVLALQARELVPYIPDAVPGWFQATLSLREANGEELAYNDDFTFHPDPVLYFEPKRDAEYVVEVKDAIFRGRDDFVYRLSISESPFITGIFPLGGSVEAPTSVALTGWNLPAATLQEPASTNTGVTHLAVTRDKLNSNPVAFAVDSLRESFDQETNDTVAAAQSVGLSSIVNGHIDVPGDTDVFKFQARAGQQIVAEVYARRLDSPLDSVLKLFNGAGQQLALNDDHEDKASGLNTHHADSYLSTVLPSAGSYYLQLTDAQRHGGSEFAYRLRLSEPRPDFELRVVPSTINIRGGMNAPITVYALRKDGFTNEIALQLDEAPAGFGLSGARVPSGADQVRLTISGTPQKDPVNVSLEGSAFINGKRVTRRAVPAEDMMQAFAYHHLVPAQELKVYVGGRFAGRGNGLRLSDSAAVKIPAGGTARVRLNVPPFALGDRFELELSEPPDGISIEKVGAANPGSEIVFKADPAKAKPGLKGNLIVNVIAGRAPAAKAKKQAAVRRTAIGVLPAIPFEILKE